MCALTHDSTNRLALLFICFVSAGCEGLKIKDNFSLALISEKTDMPYRFFSLSHLSTFKTPKLVLRKHISLASIKTYINNILKKIPSNRIFVTETKKISILYNTLLLDTTWQGNYNKT